MWNLQKHATDEISLQVTYLVSCHESPYKYENLLVEWHLRDTARHHSILTIYYILEVLNQPIVQWIQIIFAVNKFQKAVVLIDCQIFDQWLLNWVFILIVCDLSDKWIKHFFESWMASLNQVLQIVNWGRLVLYQD